MRFTSKTTTIEAPKATSEGTNLEIEQLKQVIRLLGAELKTARAQKIAPQDNHQLRALEAENKKLRAQLLEKPTDASQASLASLALKHANTQEELLALIAEKTSLLQAKKEVDESLWKTAHELKIAQNQITMQQQKEDLFQKAQDKIELLQKELLLKEKDLFTEQTSKEMLKKEHAQLTEQLHALSALQEVVATKTALIEEHARSIKSLEAQYAQSTHEHELCEKRCKETEELLVVKLNMIAELEEEKEALQEMRLSLETSSTELRTAKTQLEGALHTTEKQLQETTARSQTITKELESCKQRLTATQNRLQQLEGWKKKIEPVLTQLKNAFESTSAPEDHSFSAHRCEMAEEFVVHTPKPSYHDSLF